MKEIRKATKVNKKNIYIGSNLINFHIYDVLLFHNCITSKNKRAICPGHW